MTDQQRGPGLGDMGLPGWGDEPSTPVTRTDKAGNIWQWDANTQQWRIAIPAGQNEIRNPDEMEWNPEENREVLGRRGLPSEGNFRYVDPDDGSEWMLDMQGNKVKRLSGPNPSRVAGYQKPSVRAPQTQEEVEAARLGVRGMEQQLGAGMPFAMEQYDKIVDIISSGIAEGKFDEREGDRLLSQAMTLLDASARGMMPGDYEKNKQGVAQDIFAKRAGIAPGILQGFMGMFDKQLPPSDPKEMEDLIRGWNPMAMARSFVEEIYGGKQLTPLAQAILRGSMGGRPPTIEEKGYPPTGYPPVGPGGQ